MPTPDHEAPRGLLPEYNLGHESYGWPVEALQPPSWGTIKQQRKIVSGVDAVLQG